jgi:hypothetical protein
MSYQSVTADLREWNTELKDTTKLTVHMTHDQAKLVRALLHRGVIESPESEVESTFRAIRNSLTHVAAWMTDVTADGARIERKPKPKPLPTTPGVVFKARVTYGGDTHEGDVFVAASATRGVIKYVTPRPVGYTLVHLGDFVTAL